MSRAAAAQENWYLRLAGWLERLQGKQIPDSPVTAKR
jgi:hypothetical protein